jgi:hypothetical protein
MWLRLSVEDFARSNLLFTYWSSTHKEALFSTATLSLLHFIHESKVQVESFSAKYV